MLHDWGVIAAAFGYIGFLFLVASYGDRLSPTQRGRASALIVTLALAAFAVLFGTGQAVATERQHGLMLAVATESIVKLVAFIAAGAFVTFWMFGPVELAEGAMKSPEAVRAISYVPSLGNFLTMVLL